VRNDGRPVPAGNFAIPPHYTLAEIEKLAILQTLERTRWNKRKAASILGVYRPTLYHKLKKYNLTEHINGVERRQQVKKPAQGNGQGQGQGQG
jgi:DNA-binding NtrC family response regulator